MLTQVTADPMVRPHDGVGGITPTPRKDRAASAPIFPGMEIVVKTMMVATRLGSSWVASTWISPAPIAREACTKTRPLSDMARLRRTRAVDGQPRIPMMRIIIGILGALEGRMAEIAIMNTSCGNPRMTSVVLEATASHQPPK